MDRYRYISEIMLRVYIDFGVILTLHVPKPPKARYIYMGGTIPCEMIPTIFNTQQHMDNISLSAYYQVRSSSRSDGILIIADGWTVTNY